MKAYALKAEHARLLPELVNAAKELAGTALPKHRGYAVAFAGVRCGRDGNLVFVD